MRRNVTFAGMSVCLNFFESSPSYCEELAAVFDSTALN